MSNFVFYDFETSSSNKYWGQIIQIGAVLTNDNLDELDRFDARCRLSPGIISGSHGADREQDLTINVKKIQSFSL